MSIASDLTQLCLIHNKKPEEAVETFAKIHEMLQDWFTGEPLKEHVMKLLDVVLPERNIDGWRE